MPAANVTTTDSDWNQPGNLEDFIHYHADWHFDWLDVPDFIRRAAFILEYPMVDRDPIERWTFGRVTLLGDAAHPTLQSLAQGACMAIEDAVTLAECIEQADGDFASAFRTYETARYLRTARVQYESRYLWDNFYHVEGIEREVMRQDASARSEQTMFDCVAWLYDGFALPQPKGAAA